MSCCCKTIHDFCNVIDTCKPDTLKSIFSLMPAGFYYIVLESPIGIERISMTINNGETLLSDTGRLNENMTYKGFIEDFYHNRIPITYAQDSTADCFTIKTKTTVTNE